VSTFAVFEAVYDKQRMNMRAKQLPCSNPIAIQNMYLQTIRQHVFLRLTYIPLKLTCTSENWQMPHFIDQCVLLTCKAEFVAISVLGALHQKE